ncbi:hypothetical protein Taro_022338 [Colocasia esculenta]|uniref:Uncharacterized protein n=1 Tax=Colocasia esculenta TaxID=4460 RepID=A0A843V7M3_COLES|nr:hypothetical protein [Colocasia esculenta]
MRDKLELKAVNDGSVSYAALERKAELYEKLCRGELPDEEEKEKYCVDFFTKSIVQEEAELPEVHESPGVPPVSEEDETDAVSLATKLIGPGRTSVTMNKDEHKHFVREVHEQASEAREKASLLKLRRQEQEAARREKLKQAYLRKQLEKLKAGKTEPS